jgi:hypothetical protein
MLFYITVFIALFVLGWLIFFIPCFIAFRRQHPNRWAILVINTVFGGTGIGWLGALVWALRVVHLPGESSQSRGGQSGLNLFANDVTRVELLPPACTLMLSEGRTRAETIAELEKLIKLRDGGFLTISEYEQMKADLLRKAGS